MSTEENEGPKGEHPCDDGTCDCDCPEAREGREEAPLTLESMGLSAFRSGEALICPKCQAPSPVMAMEYHDSVIISMDGDKPPCQEWVEKNLVGRVIGEHLCLRCARCNYGFPMRCADA